MSDRVEVRTVHPDDWELFSRLRLAALQDTPTAFASSYEREADRTEEQWREWLGRSDGARFLASTAGEPSGIAAVYLRREERDAPDPVPELVSMWVRPEHRGMGVGRTLVDAVSGWVAERGHAEVRLMVAADNPAAERFYERLGFTRTGYTQPFPHDDARSEHEMSRSLSLSVGPTGSG